MTDVRDPHQAFMELLGFYAGNIETMREALGETVVILHNDEEGSAQVEETVELRIPAGYPDDGINLREDLVCRITINIGFVKTGFLP